MNIFMCISMARFTLQDKPITNHAAAEMTQKTRELAVELQARSHYSTARPAFKVSHARRPRTRSERGAASSGERKDALDGGRSMTLSSSIAGFRERLDPHLSAAIVRHVGNGKPG